MAAKTLLALACLFSTSWGFSLPKIFKDGMVLQSDAWQIWGFMGDSDKTIRVNFDCSGGLTMDAIANQVPRLRTISDNVILSIEFNRTVTNGIFLAILLTQELHAFSSSHKTRIMR